MQTKQAVNYDNLIFCYLDENGKYITEQNKKEIKYLKIYELSREYVSNSANSIHIKENNQRHRIYEIKKADLNKHDKKKLIDRTNELIEKITMFFNLRGDRDENKFKEYNNYLEEKNKREKEEELKKQEDKENERQKEIIKRANHIGERNGNDNTKTNYQPQENLYQQKECCIVRFFKWLFCCGCCSRDSVNVKD